MTENPYAPPSADLGSEAVSRAAGRGDFDLGQCLSDAWSNTWANFPLWLGVGIVGTLASLLALLSVVGLVLVVPVLAWGATRFTLRMHDGGAEFGDLFAGFSRYGNALAGILVVVVLTTLPGLVAQLPRQALELSGSATPVLLGLAAVLEVGVALFVYMRFYFAYFFVVDLDLPPVEALQRSWNETARLQWKLIALLLLGAALLVAGTLALLVGVIPATVMIYLMAVSAYRQVVGSPAGA